MIWTFQCSSSFPLLSPETFSVSPGTMLLGNDKEDDISLPFVTKTPLFTMKKFSFVLIHLLFLLLASDALLFLVQINQSSQYREPTAMCQRRLFHFDCGHTRACWNFCVWQRVGLKRCELWVYEVTGSATQKRGPCGRMVCQAMHGDARLIRMGERGRENARQRD